MLAEQIPTDVDNLKYTPALYMQAIRPVSYPLIRIATPISVIMPTSLALLSPYGGFIDVDWYIEGEEMKYFHFINLEVWLIPIIDLIIAKKRAFIPVLVGAAVLLSFR